MCFPSTASLFDITFECFRHVSDDVVFAHTVQEAGHIKLREHEGEDGGALFVVTGEAAREPVDQGVWGLPGVEVVDVPFLAPGQRLTEHLLSGNGVEFSSC
uniref:Uncharacterized protein n=1 Tax=Cacopsylla melanoneura TaxID=428564 RepID=A0A8D8UB33_9HEMI